MLGVIAIALVGLVTPMAEASDEAGVHVHGTVAWGYEGQFVEAECHASRQDTTWIFSGTASSGSTLVVSVSCQMNGGPWTTPIPTGLEVANTAYFAGCWQDGCPGHRIIQYVTVGTAPVEGSAARLCVRMTLVRSGESMTQCRS